VSTPLDLQQWAHRHGVSLLAYTELLRLFNVYPEGAWDRDGPAPGSEAEVSVAVRVECSRRGWRVWRNNVGAGTMDDGSFIRFGLANDSKRLNEALKSSDLIGWTDRGVFVALECKAPGWRYTGTERERAQLAWLQLVVAAGGIGRFVTGVHDL